MESVDKRGVPTLSTACSEKVEVHCVFFSFIFNMLVNMENLSSSLSSFSGCNANCPVSA